MPAILGNLDGWSLALILVCAGFYGSALVAVGSVPLRLALRDMPAAAHTILAHQLRLAAWIAIVLVLLQWPLQAAFLGGGTLASAIDPFLLTVVFESPQGARMLLAVLGLMLVQAVLLERGRAGLLAPVLGLLGGFLVLLAFIQVGHTRAEPRWLLAGLLLLHLAAVAFWIAALLPLYRLTKDTRDCGATAQLLTRFGRIAAGIVALLLVAGVTLAWMLLGGLEPLLTTGYGQVLMLKLLAVAALLGFAAGNKWLLVPGLTRRGALAWTRLHRSIAIEMLLALIILLVTALLTSAVPPGQ